MIPFNVNNYEIDEYNDDPAQTMHDPISSSSTSSSIPSSNKPSMFNNKSLDNYDENIIHDINDSDFESDSNSNFNKFYKIIYYYHFLINLRMWMVIKCDHW